MHRHRERSLAWARNVGEFLRNSVAPPAFDAIHTGAEPVILCAHDHTRTERFPYPDRPRHADGRANAALLDSGVAVVGNPRARLSAGAGETPRRAADRVPRHAWPRRRDGRILRPPRCLAVVRPQRGERAAL